ncbi:MAG: hypothetical protein V4772_24140, partial [Pseudomonadota bacterium]
LLCKFMTPGVAKSLTHSARSEGISHDVKEVPVECLYDFSEEICYFTDEVRQMGDRYGVVRYVYGFG